MLENIEITLWQCVTAVPVSELIVGFLGGSKELRQLLKKRQSDRKIDRQMPVKHNLLGGGDESFPSTK